jgi:hypothetical protein
MGELVDEEVAGRVVAGGGGREHVREAAASVAVAVRQDRDVLVGSAGSTA